MSAMTFWIVAAGLMGLTCLALLAALAGGRTADSDADHDRRFYEAQIAEIDRQKALGLMGEAEADAARTEAARRLLASAESPSVASSTGGRRLAAVAVLVGVPLIALPIYVMRGAPDVPGFALATREKPKPDAAGATDITAAIQQIEAHLQKNPEDGRGNEVIAPVYLRMGRHADAVRAYATALRILGATADRHANLGEARVFEANGVVTAEAKAAFEAAMALDPTHAKARFFRALAAEQDGDRPRAVTLLAELHRDLPAGGLKAEIARQLALLGSPPPEAGAIAALPQGEQMQAVRGMVDGLAGRLAATGGSAEEWARLIRALRVLGETERADAILAEARQKFAANPDDLRRIENATRATP
jgi:cytochrome c-type biogenesis protein CcmH